MDYWRPGPARCLLEDLALVVAGGAFLPAEFRDGVHDPVSHLPPSRQRVVRAGFLEVQGLAHLHGEMLRLHGVAAGGLQLFRADEADGNDRGARGQGEPADAGPAAVKDPVPGAGSLGVDADAPAVLE